MLVCMAEEADSNGVSVVESFGKNPTPHEVVLGEGFPRVAARTYSLLRASRLENAVSLSDLSLPLLSWPVFFGGLWDIHF